MQGVLVSGTHSGSGKTTVALGLLAALQSRGLRIRGFKAGPDFIDAGLQSLVTGTASCNLDSWMCGVDGVRETFAAASAGSDIAVVEGAMGLFDGDSGGAALALTLGLPVLLVVDAFGLAESAGAVVLGFQEYARRHHPGLRWAGILFNRVGSESHYRRLRESVRESEVLGYLPRDPLFALPQRHLGLWVAEEEPFRPGSLRALGETVQWHVDIPRLLDLAGPPVSAPRRNSALRQTAASKPRIGVARDRAFCFLYKENLDLLEEAGAQLVFFSPLEVESLPPDLAALYFAGGYPELNAERLSGNRSLREAIRRFAEAGGSVYAECGGLMFLARALVDLEGRRFPMCGLLPFETHMREKRVALGYREVELKADCLLGRRGDRLRGHEYHYSEAVEVPDGLERLYRVSDNRGGRKEDEGYRLGAVMASYIHLHFRSRPEAAAHWVDFLMTRVAAR